MMTNIENFKSGVEHSMELLGSEPIQENLKQFFFRFAGITIYCSYK